MERCGTRQVQSPTPSPNPSPPLLTFYPVVDLSEKEMQSEGGKAISQHQIASPERDRSEMRFNVHRHLLHRTVGSTIKSRMRRLGDNHGRLSRGPAHNREDA
jgi:hypothetical protein